MNTELPACNKCCFCLPLRHSLIIWGYFEILIATLLLITIFFDWFRIFELPLEDSHKITGDFILFTFTATIIAIGDIILSFMFVVGCHQRNVKLIKAFYFYSQFLLVMTTALGVYDFIWMMNRMFHNNYDDMLPLDTWICQFINSSLYFADISLQIYVLLLVRSEIMKVKKTCRYSFARNAAETLRNLDNENFDGPKNISSDKNHGDGRT